MIGASLQSKKLDAIDYDARMMNLCTNCTKLDCPGECTTYKTLRRKLMGGTPQAALYTYNGETMTLADWAERLGMTYMGLYSRVKRPGMTFEKAIEMGSPIQPEQHVAFGRSQTMRQWAEDYGIAEHTLRRRVRVGMSLEKALTQPVATKFRGKKNGR